MKKNETIYNVIIIALVVAIAVLVVYRFVLKKDTPVETFALHNVEKATVTDLSGDTIPLKNLVGTNGTVFCLILLMSDCQTCVYKGMVDIKNLTSAGKQCVTLMVHDIPDEVGGWASVNDMSPVYMLKKADFYQHVQSPVTPVLVTFENGKVRNYRYIQP